MASSSQSTDLNNQRPDVIWYNQSFHSSVCHVCKKYLLPSKIICECRMIYYCSIAHKLDDYMHHVSFCTVIQSIYAQVECEHFRAPTLNRVDWTNSRHTLINLIEHRLARPLYLYEKQMIMFVKSCLVCRAQENLLSCRQCYCVNYCVQHKTEATEIHGSNCSDLLRCFKLDIQRKCQTFKIKFTKFSKESTPLENMDEFVEQYITKTQIGRLLTISYTDYLSDPLTLCYWIQQFDLLKPESMASPNFAVHIIDANVLDREYIDAWHLLLHYLPHVRKLRVELIGSVTSYESDPTLVCSFCSDRNKLLTYGCYCESYQQYVSAGHYKKPNVILGFESNLKIWDDESIAALKRTVQCPMIITGQSKEDLDTYLCYVQSREKDIAFSYNFYEAVVNPFCSRRPYRKNENDGVFYRNKFVVVLKS